MTKIKLIIFLLSPILVMGQSNCGLCSNPQNKKVENITYYGCLNDHDQFHGFGELNIKEGKTVVTYNGCFEYDKYHGKGKMTIKTNNQTATYEGMWSKGKRHGEGVSSNMIKDNIMIYKGMWDNDKKHGKGKMTIKANEITRIEEGEFVFDNLYTGTKTNRYESGEEIIELIEKGKTISEKSNIENLYDSNDIDCKDGLSTLRLETRDNHYYLKMDIGGAENLGEWIFDTGAYGLTISRKQWERLKKEGAKYDDLGISHYTTGISEIANDIFYIKLHEIKIGNCLVKNVVATVYEDLNSNSLMGADFYKKFSNVVFSSKEETVKFYE